LRQDRLDSYTVTSDLRFNDSELRALQVCSLGAGTDNARPNGLDEQVICYC